MNFESVDWNKVWKDKRKNIPKKRYSNKYWNKRAPSFSAHAHKSKYAREFLSIIKPCANETVLDMGCGSGTLAIPLASKVKKITAVDFSENMLHHLRDYARKDNIKNIKIIKASWEDDWENAKIGTHDIAVASRSVAIDDLKKAINKLDKAAKKRVYISTVVGDGPHDRKIFEAIRREFITPIDYIYVVNLLYQMGINANVNYISDKYDRIYDSHEAAMNSFYWMLNELTPDEEIRLSGFLKKHLIRKDSKWVIDYKKEVKWAVIWWEKDSDN
ncbi:MAG: methyltransferase domain-containing protein [Spirochaetes bacterium]|nr:methyltransferase domain-containing protein [Spirochaetota bacterium]